MTDNYLPGRRQRPNNHQPYSAFGFETIMKCHSSANSHDRRLFNQAKWSTTRYSVSRIASSRGRLSYEVYGAFCRLATMFENF